MLEGALEGKKEDVIVGDKIGNKLVGEDEEIGFVGDRLGIVESVTLISHK
jgi:hypothetical protein